MAGTPAQIQTLYGLGGERWILEWEVPWLGGYQGATPVRVGNAAGMQLEYNGRFFPTLGNPGEVYSHTFRVL